MYQFSGVSNKKNNGNDQLPLRLLVSYSSSTEKTLEDVMCVEIKVGTSTNELKDLRLILRGFVYFDGSTNKNLHSHNTTCETGHYLTFIYLNDNRSG